MTHTNPDNEIDTFLDNHAELYARTTMQFITGEITEDERDKEWHHSDLKTKHAILALIDTHVKKTHSELLDALYYMYIQYCSNGHDFMGAGETASELLENADYITVDGAGRIIKDKGDSNENPHI